MAVQIDFVVKSCVSYPVISSTISERKAMSNARGTVMAPMDWGKCGTYGERKKALMADEGRDSGEDMSGQPSRIS